jgi:Protein of unknown function (DUF3592)
VFDFIKRHPVLWLFVLAWSVGTLAFDFLDGRVIDEAVRSESFHTTPGVITRSDLGRGRDRDPFDVEYKYTVNGRQYTGTRYEVRPQVPCDRHWRAVRDAHPVGTQVTVHFDPDDPQAAYLAPGLRPEMLFVVWWLTPLNLLMVGMLRGGLRGLRGRRAFDPARRRCVWRTRDGWAARPDPDATLPAAVCLVLFFITFWGSVALVAYLSAFEYPPPWWLPITMWVVGLTGAIVLGAYASWEALIRVNESEGTIGFAAGMWKYATVARERVRGVGIETETRKEMRNEKEFEYEVFLVTIRWQNNFDCEQVMKLADYENRADADALAGWLREKLGLPAPPPAEPAAAEPVAEPSVSGADESARGTY